MDKEKELQEHLLELLKGESAHISLEAALNDFPVEYINTRVSHSPHTAWRRLLFQPRQKQDGKQLLRQPSRNTQAGTKVLPRRWFCKWPDHQGQNLFPRCYRMAERQRCPAKYFQCPDSKAADGRFFRVDSESLGHYERGKYYYLQSVLGCSERHQRYPDLFRLSDFRGGSRRINL